MPNITISQRLPKDAVNEIIQVREVKVLDVNFSRTIMRWAEIGNVITESLERARQFITRQSEKGVSGEKHELRKAVISNMDLIFEMAVENSNKKAKALGISINYERHKYFTKQAKDLGLPFNDLLCRHISVGFVFVQHFQNLAISTEKLDRECEDWVRAVIARADHQFRKSVTREDGTLRNPTREMNDEIMRFAISQKKGAV